MIQLRHFKESELNKPGANIDPMVASWLDLARSKAGFPFIVNRGADTEENNKAVGGTETSLHVPHNSPNGLARAFDIEYHGPKECFLMVHALMDCGFNNIIVYDTHIHAEYDEGAGGYLKFNA